MTLPRSQFDPLELIGLPMPCLDPFRQDLSELETLSSLISLSMPLHHRAVLTALPVGQDSCQKPPQCVIKSADTAIRARPEHAQELEEAVSDFGRVRLTPALAIHIFHQGKTKTKHSAALLSAEFGVSAKAIRDIWRKQTWAPETRPHWTLDDKLSFDSPGQP